MNNVRDYVDDLFAKYPSSSDMADFKEEICVNLQERINYHIKNGADDAAAFDKATSELGDVSAIAEQISREKHKEVFEAMYMKSRNYLGKKHIIGYTLAVGLILFGIITAFIGYWASGQVVSGIGVLVPFFVAPVSLLVFLALTQETARSYPMAYKRALLYTLCVGLILFGLVTMVLSYYATGLLYAAAGTLIPFVLPGIMGLGVLVLTEKSRHKPWFAQQQAQWEKRVNEQFADPHLATRFGLYSGALWITTVALFFLLGFAVGFHYSWLAFLFATAAQIFLQAKMMTKK